VKALLLDKGVELEERDFFQDSLNETQLRDLLNGRSAAEIFSWNSPSFKKLGLARSELTDQDLIRMMSEEPRFIRRPLTVLEGQIIVGSDKQSLRHALG
jgi:arsenate reductase-like glutaredoxin family protein